MKCDEQTINAELNTRAAIADSGESSAFILILGAGDRVLSKLNMSKEAFAPARNGRLEANQILDDISAQATGDPEKFVITNDEGSFEWTGDIGDELKLSPKGRIFKGAVVSITCDPSATISIDTRPRPIKNIPAVKGELSLKGSDSEFNSTANVTRAKPSGSKIDQVRKGEEFTILMTNYKSRGGPSFVEVYVKNGDKQYKCAVTSNTNEHIRFILNDKKAPHVINNPGFVIRPILSKG